MVEERILPTDIGPVSVRIYTPKGTGPFPVLMYFHGGGWVWCDADTHEATCRHLCRLADCIVIFVNYRRSPEYRFPAANDDAYYATKWVSDHAGEIHADPSRIAVGGDSAGGNMSAVLALRARETMDFRLAFQLLVYPVTDMSDMDGGTYETYGEGYFLTKALMKWFREQYLNSMEEALLPQVSPLLEKDLTGLPPALAITAEFDPLRQEGEAYAQRLADAGVAVQCSRYNGMIHPFWSMAGKIDQALAAYREAAGALQKAFGNA